MLNTKVICSKLQGKCYLSNKLVVYWSWGRLVLVPKYPRKLPLGSKGGKNFLQLYGTRKEGMQ